MAFFLSFFFEKVFPNYIREAFSLSRFFYGVKGGLLFLFIVVSRFFYVRWKQLLEEMEI